MHGGDGGGKLYFLLLKLIKHKKSPVLGEVSQLILSAIVDMKDRIHGSEHLLCWNTSLPGFVYICDAGYWNTEQGAKRSFENAVKMFIL